MNAAEKAALLRQLVEWRDQDEPLVEAIGNAIAQGKRLDAQEQARRIVSAVIEVLDREL